MSHNSSHPPDAPPIRTEEATVYADLDMQRMGVKTNGTDEAAPKQTDQQVYENYTQSVYENYTLDASPDNMQESSL